MRQRCAGWAWATYSAWYVSRISQPPLRVDLPCSWQVPQPASCWTLEGGETYNWAFTTYVARQMVDSECQPHLHRMHSGASGTTLAPQGFTEYGFSLTKQ